MGDEEATGAVPGFVEPGVAEEFPGLRLDWLSLAARDRPSPPELVGRLRDLSNRFNGANVIAMRTKPIPHAYRAFFRQIGLDPDTTRIPSEAAAVARLFDGRFRSVSLVPDALAIALIETGIPVWALDADRVGAGGPGIRTARAGERLGSGPYADHLQPGTLVVADAEAVHAVLFGSVARDHLVGSDTRRIVLFAVSVAGVPLIHVEEALWIAIEALHPGGAQP
jgi:DNA/RNA-binding domain of Phe-tRNA-synthetase-like protein